MKNRLFIIAAAALCIAAIIPFIFLFTRQAHKPAETLPDRITVRGLSYDFAEYASGCVMWDIANISDPYGNESYEAVKAAALAETTTLLALIGEDGALPEFDGFPMPHYMTAAEREEHFGEDTEIYKAAADEAVSYALSKKVTYDGKYVVLPVGRISGGSSADPAAMGFDMPWCRKLFFPKDCTENGFSGGCQLTEQGIISVVLSSFEHIWVPPADEDRIKILSRDDDGNVLFVNVCGVTVSGYEFRRLFGIRSLCFELYYADGLMDITTKGDGDCTGLIMSAADMLSKRGKSCEEILTAFFFGLDISDR